eukprot:m.110793 g.110793  ORF g.110793 m.110793 type:complete len:497 (+) comp10730_c1_seq1:151-1641(+)
MPTSKSACDGDTVNHTTTRTSTMSVGPAQTRLHTHAHPLRWTYAQGHGSLTGVYLIGVVLRLVVWAVGLYSSAHRDTEPSEWTWHHPTSSSMTHHPLVRWLHSAPPMLDTPYTSAVSVSECVAYIQTGQAPYDSVLCRHPPLLIALHYSLSDTLALGGLVWIALDVVCVVLLVKLATMGRAERGDREDRAMAAWSVDTQQALRGASVLGHTTLPDDGAAVAAIWLLNPLTLVSSCTASLYVVRAVVVLVSINMVARRHVVLATVSAVFGMYVDPYLVYALGLPVAISAWQQRCVGTAVATLLACGTALCAISFSLEGSWRWVDVVYGSTLRMDDVTPNTGLYWYLFTIVFPRFRAYFLALTHINCLVVVTVMALRLANDLPFATMVLLGVTAVLKTYPAAPDFALVVALLTTRPELLPFCRYHYAAAAALMTIVVLMSPFWYAWVHDTGGNANFVFALTLAYAVVQCVVINDFLRAHFTVAWLLKHGLPIDKLKLA